MVATIGSNWRLAPSLVALIDQADKLWPKRSIASDGSIGDAGHAKRISDHNPDASGDVLAIDLTDDKWAGCDADAFAEHLRVTRDHRVKYVICNGRIFRSYGTQAWKWTPYTGLNGHFAHTHVSILDTDAAKNDTSPWFPTTAPPPPPPPPPLEDDVKIHPIRHSNGTLGLVMPDGDLVPLATTDELDAYRLIGVDVADRHDLADGYAWDLIAGITARRRAAAAGDPAAVAREVAALVIPAVVAALGDALADEDGEIALADVQAATEAAIRNVLGSLG